MIFLLNQRSLLESNDLISHFLMMRMMWYDNSCGILEFMRKHFHNHIICLGIYRFCRFIKDNNLRIAQ